MKDVFGAVLGVEGKDYFVTTTLPNGNRVCYNYDPASFARKPDATVCCAEKRTASYSSYNRTCGKKATSTKMVERTVTTGGSSRYGQHWVSEFEIDANDFVVKDQTNIKEMVEVGYCGQHDPAKVAARQAAKDEEQRATRNAQIKREDQERDARTVRDAKMLNSHRVELITLDLLKAIENEDYLSIKTLAAALRSRMAYTSVLIAAGRANYGNTSNYMLDNDGMLKPEYAPKGKGTK